MFGEPRRQSRAGVPPAQRGRLAREGFKNEIKCEADEFYAQLQKDITDPGARDVQRRALARIIWSKRFFYYDVLNRPMANLCPSKCVRWSGQILSNNISIAAAAGLC